MWDVSKNVIYCIILDKRNTVIIYEQVSILMIYSQNIHVVYVSIDPLDTNYFYQCQYNCTLTINSRDSDRLLKKTRTMLVSIFKLCAKKLYL